MHKPDPAPRWYQPWRRPEGSAPSDPADLGTCFGLEATLAAEPAPTKTSAAPSRRPGWMQRFTSKRRASL
jgi:hypothetical protein